MTCDNDYLPRLAEQHITAAAGVQPVVVILGARQTGKSTLVREHPGFRGYSYLTLDSADIREQAVRDPAGLLARAPDLILNEVQRVPDLLIAVKEAVDCEPRRRPGQFILTGSANLLGRNLRSESLAGRASYTTLWPFTRREQLGLGRAGVWDDLKAARVQDWPELLMAQDAPAADWRTTATRSGYPVPTLALPSSDEQAIWFDSNIDTYIDRDVREIAQIASPLDLRRLMRFVCASAGQVENQTAWGRAAGMKRATVSRYLDLLETTYQLVRIPAYAVNRSKRLTRSPKVYWSDTAMALRLADVRAPSGQHFENLIVSDLLAWSSSRAPRPAIFHWRTTEHEEVDFVVEFPDDALFAIEIKGGARPGWSDVGKLRLFLDEYDAAVGGLVVHGGEETYRLSERIVATRRAQRLSASKKESPVRRA